jgi:hypothetical protein
MTKTMAVPRGGGEKDFAEPSPPSQLHGALVTFAMAALTASLWLLIHRYLFLYHDGQLYAFEALAKIEPGLHSDLFLGNLSQSKFTVFPWAYAELIRCCGLRDATMILTIAFTAGSLAATWFLAKRIVTANEAWLILAFSVVTVGFYGAYGVFHYSEGFLTARLPAEALIITALALYWHRRWAAAFGIASIALFVHPLMALPGLLLILCLSLPIRLAVPGALLGVAAVLCVSLASTHISGLPYFLKPMDPAWLAVVRERSQFLFLQLWRPVDWGLNLRPFFCLALSAVVIRKPLARKLCFAAILVGASGLAIAAIASFTDAPAVLMQGQAWRWMWVTQFASVVLTVPTAMALWREAKCGPLCALLLVMEWTCACFDPLVCVTLAGAIWSLRDHVPDRMLILTRLTTATLVLIITAWVIGSMRALPSANLLHLGSVHESLLILRLRNFFGLQITAVACAFCVWRWVTLTKSEWIPAAAATALLAISVVATPVAFSQVEQHGSEAEIEEFADWRAIIPPGKNVLVADGGDSGAFVWFTLGRDNYLTTAQSAGVVFSRETALEVARRSDVLLPIEDPDWKVLTATERRVESGSMQPKHGDRRPLTARALQEVCSDPALGYVISKEDVGFEPIRHARGRQWKDWNLYDCARVRADASNL